MDVFGDPVGGAAWRLDCARALACALACLSSGCFKGDAAQGLPCEQDRDCGVDDRCVAGFCGGPPDGATAGETSGSSSGGSGSTTDIPAGCGNGMADPREQCEPAVAGTPDADCDIDCTLPLCGDGLVNGYALNTAVGDGVSVEQCDPGSVDADDCDVDCTIPECGDGHFNDQAETCDDDNAVEVDACTNACQPTLLAADFDDGALEMTNNRSERQLRRVATGRQAWLFVGSDLHGLTSGYLLTLIASARLHRLDPEVYLRDVFRVLPHWPRDRYLELAPRYWRITRARLRPDELDHEVGWLTIPEPHLPTMPALNPPTGSAEAAGVITAP